MGYDRLRFVPARALFGSGLGFEAAFGLGYVSERWDAGAGAGAGGGGAKYTGSGGGLEGAFEYACDCEGCVLATDADLRESGRGLLPCDGTWAWFWCAWPEWGPAEVGDADECELDECESGSGACVAACIIWAELVVEVGDILSRYCILVCEGVWAV